MLADEKQRRELYRLLVEGPRGETRIAVVGASADPAKYGNIIVNNLVGRGFTVLPVNPRGGEIAGLAVSTSLAEVPGPIHLVNLVTPPSRSLAVLEEAARLGLPAIWFQEGSHDRAVLDRLAQLPIIGLADACIMVVAGWSGLPG